MQEGYFPRSHDPFVAKLSLEHNLPVCSLGYVYCVGIPLVLEMTFGVGSYRCFKNVSSFSERNKNLTIALQYLMFNLHHLVEHFFLSVDFFFFGTKVKNGGRLSWCCLWKKHFLYCST